jgi:hypothetical protein
VAKGPSPLEAGSLPSSRGGEVGVRDAGESLRADVERPGRHGIPAFEAPRPALAIDPVERATRRLVEHAKLHRNEISRGDQQAVSLRHTNAMYNAHDPVFDLAREQTLRAVVGEKLRAIAFQHALLKPTAC